MTRRRMWKQGSIETVRIYFVLGYGNEDQSIYLRQSTPTSMVIVVIVTADSQIIATLPHSTLHFLHITTDSYFGMSMLCQQLQLHHPV